MSASHLARIERGERFPSRHILRKLAEPLGSSETDLLKAAGFMSWDESDDRLEQFKRETKRQIKRYIARVLIDLYRKVDAYFEE